MGLEFLSLNPNRLERRKMGLELSLLKQKFDAHRIVYKGVTGDKGYHRFLQDICFMRDNEIPYGEHIEKTLERMVQRTKIFNLPCYAYFNGHYLVARPGDTTTSLLHSHEERVRAYRNSTSVKILLRQLEMAEEEGEVGFLFLQVFLEEDKDDRS